MLGGMKEWMDEYTEYVVVFLVFRCGGGGGGGESELVRTKLSRQGRGWF
jgi:hypothetical protein